MNFHVSWQVVSLLNLGKSLDAMIPKPKGAMFHVNLQGCNFQGGFHKEVQWTCSKRRTNYEKILEMFCHLPATSHDVWMPLSKLPFKYQGGSPQMQIRPCKGRKRGGVAFRGMGPFDSHDICNVNRKTLVLSSLSYYGVP